MSQDDSSFWWVWAAVGYFCFLGISSMRYSKLRYSIQYGVDYDQVTKLNKPHDCDWFKAPLGDKECHYDVQLTTVLIRAENSDPAKYPVKFVSFDSGKTWFVDDAVPPTKPQVTISWEKVED